MRSKIMKTTHTKAALNRISTIVLALWIALILAVPAHAEIELEPDGFTSSATAVASTAPSAPGGDSAASAQKSATAAVHGPADAGELRSAPRTSAGSTLWSFVNWLWSLPFFGG
jgi:hypothetical protein